MPAVPKQLIYSFDVEATGLDLHHGAKPYYVSFCDQDDNVTSWEAPVDPITREPKWEKRDLREMQQFIDEADILVAQNGKFDVKALNKIGVGYKFPWYKLRDTLMAGHLLASNQPHDLTTMVLVYLNINVQPFEDNLEAAVKEAKKIVKKKYPNWRLAKEGLPEMPSIKSSSKRAEERAWKYDAWLPAAVAYHEDYDEDHEWFDVLAEYCNSDSSSTIKLWFAQEELIKKKGLMAIYMERLKLLPIIYRMELIGMTYSVGRWQELYGKLESEAEECKKACLELADNEIDDLPLNGVSNDLKYVIFEKFGLKSNKKTATGKPSLDKFVLEHFIATLPENSKQWKFIKNLRSYRKRQTALGYLSAYKKYALPYKENKKTHPDVVVLHPGFNPTGSDTLRWSSQYPNAMQVSKQEECNTRYVYGPAPGKEWWVRDYSNLELRIPAYEAGEEEMVFLFEHPDEPPYYGSYHMLVFDTLHPDKFAKHGMKCKEIYESTWYQWTKNGNFAVQYGAVLGSGTADAAYHVKGAQRKIMSRFRQIKQLSNSYIQQAKKYGYVETLPDRTVDPKRGYPIYCARTKWGGILETTPLSYHVQSTAMWIMCKAMIRCQEYLDNHPESGGKIICQIHDELIFEFPTGKGIKHIDKLGKLMKMSGDDVGIPLETSCKYHPVAWSISQKPTLDKERASVNRKG